MRLSNEDVKSLQTLLKDEFGLNYTDEQTQEAGMAIMRFVIAKAQRRQELAKNKGDDYGQVPRTDGTVTQ